MQTQNLFDKTHAAFLQFVDAMFSLSENEREKYS
jgi:hypothetical protein